MAKFGNVCGFFIFASAVVFTSAIDGYDPAGDVDPCASNPCENGGSCVPSLTTWYKCHCLPRFYGWNCEEEVEPGTMKIEVNNCEMDEITEDDSKTVGEWCAQNMYNGSDPLSVRVVGAETGQSYNFEIVMIYEEEETVVSQVMTASGEDFTDNVKAMDFAAPDAKMDIFSGRFICNNYDAYLSMRISPAAGGDNFETDKHRVTVLCRAFRDAEVALTASDSIPVLNADNTGTNFGNLIASSGVTFQVQQLSTMALPILGADAQYYLVAFLTKRKVLPPTQCDKESDVPELTFADEILWYKRFAGMDDVSGFDSELRGMQIDAPKRCGEHNLVILVDALGSLAGENRCNNYVVMQINLGGCAPAEEAQCHVIGNPYSNGRETAFTYHNGLYGDTISGNDLPDNRMYKLRFQGAWKQEMDSDMDMVVKNKYEVNRDGYGRLKLLERYIRDQLMTGTLYCDGLDDDELTSKIRNMEGLDAAETPVPGTPFDMMVPSYFSALMVLDELRSNVMSAEQVRNWAIGGLLGIPHPVNNTMREKLSYWVQTAALMAVANYSEAVMNNYVDSMKAEAPSFLCRIGESMRRVTYMKRHIPEWDQNAEQLDNQLGQLIGDITSTMVLMKEFYRGATFISCMDKMFEKITKFVIQEVEDDKWLYENQCNSGENNCLKKVMAVCGSGNDCRYETRFSDDEQLCVLRLVKDLVERKYRAYGIHDLRRKMRKDERDREMRGEEGARNCNGEDPMSPRAGPVYLYKLVDGTVWKGEPKVDGDQTICWNPVAVCTCSSCGPAPPAMKKRRRK